MALVRYTAFNFDWVRVFAPTQLDQIASMKLGSNATILATTNPDKPPRDYVDGRPLNQAEGASDFDVPAGHGLYVRCISHRSCDVWVEQAAVPVSNTDLAAMSGWASYVDTEYTEENPLELGSNRQWTELPNNAGFVIDSQLPSDIDSFYEDGKITGRSGDGVGIAIRFKMQASTNGLVAFNTGVDIGGDFGVIFETNHTPPKGRNTEQPITHSFQGYQLDTWEANGGVVKIAPRNAIRVYDIQFFIQRLHKAR